MKTKQIMCILTVLLTVATVYAGNITAVDQWTVRTDRAETKNLTTIVGETKTFRTIWYNPYSGHNFTNGTPVVMMYRPYSYEGTNWHYAIDGEVTASNTTEVVWTPAAESDARKYYYRIEVQGDAGNLPAARGILRIKGQFDWAASFSTNPPIRESIDFATVAVVNPTNSPFAMQDDLATVNSNLATHEVAADATNAAQDVVIAGKLSEESDTLATVLARGNDANNNINMGAHITSYGTPGGNYGYIGYYFSKFRFVTVNGLDSFLFQTLQPADFGAFFDFGINIGPGTYPGNGSLSVSNNITAGGMLICNGRTIADSKGLVIADGAIATNNLDDDVNASLDLADSALQTYTETDPIWVAVSNTVTTGAALGATSYGWGDHGTEGYLTAYTEGGPNVIYTGGIFDGYTHTGGTYSAADVVICTSDLLTNGVESVDYDQDGAAFFVVTQISTNGTDWITFSNFDYTATPSYIRLITETGLPMDGNSITVSNIVVSSFDYPDLVNSTNDIAGQVLHASDARNPREVVNLRVLQAAVDANDPTDWAEYPATDDVYLGTNILIMGDTWSITTSANGVGMLSYLSVTAAGTELAIMHNGSTMLSADSGVGGLQVTSLSISGNDYTIKVSTNGVESAAWIEYTENIVLPYWTKVAGQSSTYPTVADDTYTITLTSTATKGFFRAVQQLDDATMHLRGIVTCDSITITNYTRGVMVRDDVSTVITFADTSTWHKVTDWTAAEDNNITVTTSNFVFTSSGAYNMQMNFSVAGPANKQVAFGIFRNDVLIPGSEGRRTFSNSDVGMGSLGSAGNPSIGDTVDVRCRMVTTPAAGTLTIPYASLVVHKITY